MLLKKTNIEEKLIGLRKNNEAEAALIDDVYNILNRENKRGERNKATS